MKRAFCALAAMTVASVVADVRDANACGGCFAPPTEVTVVTDHRMALSISKNQTVLWDQIRYSGDPSEFAWVLPVRPSARVEVANDEFFTALDQTTQPRIFGPQQFGGNVGCGLAGCGDQSSSADGLAANGGESVQVLNQAVVGPYETVTLRSTDDDALTKWLRDHDFAIPASIEPTISAYVTEKFDFIALRLRPQCSERSMQPVRVVSPGADPTLPLRMVAAGVGAKVGITLYVISEGRWEPQNFPVTTVVDSELRWDRFQNRSTYEEYSQAKMSEQNGRMWISEASLKTPITSVNNFPVYQTSTLARFYFAQCLGLSNPNAASSSSSSSSSSGGGSLPTPCPKAPDPNATDDASSPVTDASADAANDADVDVDAASVADASVDASVDASSGETRGPDAGSPSSSGQGEDAGTGAGETKPVPRGALRPQQCAHLDDLDVAIEGLSRQDIWVTRLRATLPVNALQGADLRLQASATQEIVNNLHYVSYYTDEDQQGNSRAGCGSAPKEHRAYGSWVIGILSALGLVAIVRRRRR